MFDDDEDPEKTNMLAVDVYALSIILWQLWFKRLPFEGKSIHKIISWVGKGKRLKLDLDNHPSPPEPLKVLIQDCWAQLSTDRPHMQKVRVCSHTRMFSLLFFFSFHLGLNRSQFQ
jgi:hypothetical protein